jgi:hypothetical protein
MRNIAALLLLPLILALPRAIGATPPVYTSGEQIYVPIYSSIFYHDSKRTIDLAATLSIHNVDPDHSIIVTRVDYYDTKGKLLRKYLAKPQTLGAFETVNFVVEKTDTAGGTGANFLVEWKASPQALPPLVEALMVSLAANQSVSFTTQGRVIRDLNTKF